MPTRAILNGKDLGEHLPCFTPGYFNVKEALKTGENRLLIRVGSCRNSVPFSIPDGFDFEKDRYIPGIFDNVDLILSGTPRIISVQTAPDIINKQVRVQVKLENLNKAASSGISFIIREKISQAIAGSLSENVALSPDPLQENTVDVKIPVKDCRFWSPEDPFLYTVKVSSDGDEYETSF